MNFRAINGVGLMVALGASITGFAQPAAQNAGQGSDTAQAAGSDQLQEVVVTAERRTTDVQKTASSISVRTGAELQDQGKFSVQQIVEDVPGVRFVPSGGGGSGSDQQGSSLIIRGIQSNSGQGGIITSIAATAAVYVDSVFEGIGGDYDIDRVELLRGPQGTLYGRSATAGLLSTHTVDPNLTQWGGNASVELGNYSLQHYTAALNAPLINNVLSLRVSGNRYQRDGFFASQGNGKVGTSEGRVKLLFKPNDDFSVMAAAAVQNSVTGAGGISFFQKTPDTYTSSPSAIGHGDNDEREYFLLLNWNLGFGTLTYQPAYRTFTESSSSPLFIPGVADYNQTTATPNDAFHTEELRLASNPGSKLTWLLGGVYYHNDLNNAQAIIRADATTIGGFLSVVPEKTTDAQGLFGEVTYPITDTTRVTGGVRYDWTKIAATQIYTAYSLYPALQVIPGVSNPAVIGPPAGIRHFYNFNYKARLEHDLAPQNMVYASISTGFSPGDVTFGSGLGNVPTLFHLKAETLTAYEIGSKNRFLGNRLQVNGDVYYYFYGGYQTASVSVNPVPPELVSMTSQAEVFGGELESIYQLTAHDRIDFNVALTNAYFVGKNKDYLEGLPGKTFATYFALNGIPNIVPFQPEISWDHSFDLPGDSTLTLHGDARYLSGHDGTNFQQSYFAPIPGSAYSNYDFARVSGQAIGDFTATWAYRNYSVNAYVRNVGDNEYKTQLVNTGTSWGATPYDPRTYGIVLSARF